MERTKQSGVVNMMSPTKRVLFSSLNHKLEVDDFMCSGCDAWLTGKIFIKFRSAGNYCETCTFEVEKYPRNKTLEKIIPSLLFPCWFNECDYILKADQVNQHEQQCLHAPNYNCIICAEQGLSLDELERHLIEKHSDKTLKLESLSIELTLLLAENSVYIATFKQHLFLMHIHRTDTNLGVVISKLMNPHDKHVSNNYIINYRNANELHSVHKTFVEWSTINTGVHKFDINIKEDAQIEMKIILCGHDKIFSSSTCPICVHEMGLQMYQCENGHNMCMDCRSKVVMCAMCRSPKLNIIKLNFLFTDIQLACPNIENGCAAVVPIGELKEHEKICGFASIPCVLCRLTCTKFNINKHHQDNHLLRSNSSFAHISMNVTETNRFSSYKQNIFQCNIKIKGDEFNKRLCFNVKLLYNEDPRNAAKYRYEIHLLDRHYNGGYVLNGICQSMNDEICLLSTYYVVFEPLCYNNGDIRINYRLIIREIDPII